MNKIFFGFLVTSIAGISTLLGIIPIFFNIKNKLKLINISLGFASGVMASVSLFSLLKESYTYFNIKHTTYASIILLIIFILLGFLITSILSKLFEFIDNKLYKIGIINMLAIIIHNIPEGIITFSTMNANTSLGINLGIAIMLHNIPEGISISIPIYYSTNSLKKAFILTLISGFSEILGAIITYLFLYRFINYQFISIILALTIGIMLYISIFELMKNALNYNKKVSIISFIVGFIFMLFFK